MIYKIALHRSKEGISVSVPGLPGCWSQGDTEQEAIKNIKDAITDYFAVVDKQLQGNAFTMGGIAKDAGLSASKFKKYL